jgi:hypothetical protein
MLSTSDCRIYLAEERGHTETQWFRSYDTFSSRGIKQETKTAFGRLYVLSDDTLAAGKTESFNVEEDSLVAVFPVVGVVEYKDSLMNEVLLQAGELQLFHLPAGSSYTIHNPYEDGLVNFLQCRFLYRPEKCFYTTSVVFDIAKKRNHLIELFELQENSFTLRMSIGKFDGRKEAFFIPLKQENRIFGFVIQGAFELQNRLLEAKDGLGLCHMESVEFEALANESIVLFLEF